MKPRLPPEVVGQIPLLQQNGLNGYQIADRLRIGKTTAYRYLPKQGKPWKRWTDRDIQRLVDGYANQVPTTELARILRRSPTAVRTAMCRYRKAVRNDPERREVMHYMRVGLRAGAKPWQVVKAIRKARIAGRWADDAWRALA